MTKELFTETIKPVIVLLAICLVASALLGTINAITAPIIAENKEATATASRQELLPDATSFTKLECDDERIESVYVDDGGSGYVITAGSAGYGTVSPVL